MNVNGGEMHHNRNICETLQLINKFCRLTLFYLGVPFFFARRCMNFSLALHNRNEFVCMDLMPAACRVLLFFSFFSVVSISTHAYNQCNNECMEAAFQVYVFTVQICRQVRF